jgi:hypothetical protein
MFLRPSRQLLFKQPMVVELLGMDLDNSLDDGVIKDIWAPSCLLNGRVMCFGVDKHLVDEEANSGKSGDGFPLGCGFGWQ